MHHERLHGVRFNTDLACIRIFDKRHICHSLQKLGNSLLSGNKIPKRIVHKHLLSIRTFHHAVRTDHMRMRANHYIYSKIGQILHPLFRRFIRFILIFHPSMQKDHHDIRLFFGSFHIRFYRLFIIDINRIRFIFRNRSSDIDQGCVIHHCNLKRLLLDDLHPVRLLVFGAFMNSKHCRRRLLGFPESKGICHSFFSFIIGMIRCHGNHIESQICKGLAAFLRHSKGRVAARIVVAAHNRRLLIDNGKIRPFNLFFYIFINVIIAPHSAFLLSVGQYGVMEKVVSNSHHVQCVLLFFFFLRFFPFFLLFGLFLRLNLRISLYCLLMAGADR